MATDEKQQDAPNKDAKNENEKMIPHERFNEVNEAKKLAESKIAELQKQIEESQSKLEEIANSKKSEQEKQQESFVEMQNQLESMKAENVTNKKMNAVRDYLGGLGVPKHDRIVKLVDFNAIELGDNGISGVDKTVEALKGDYPELFEIKEKQDVSKVGNENTGNSDGDADVDHGSAIRERFNIKK